jgi:hypothetical protein
MSQSLLTKIVTAQAMTANASHILNVDKEKYAGLQIVWSALDTFDNTFTVDGSLDGTNFDLIAGSSFTPLVAAYNKLYSLDIRDLNFIRLVYTKGTATAGVYDVFLKTESDL